MNLYPKKRKDRIDLLILVMAIIIASVGMGIPYPRNIGGIVLVLIATRWVSRYVVKGMPERSGVSDRVKIIAGRG